MEYFLDFQMEKVDIIVVADVILAERRRSLRTTNGSRKLDNTAVFI